jgi:hypothetical protein
MTVYCVTHTRYEGEKLTHLRIGRVNTTKPAWDGPMRDVPVLEVVDLITTGDDVYISQVVEALRPPGAKLEVLSHADGVEYLREVDGPVPGRGLKDLPSF